MTKDFPDIGPNYISSCMYCTLAVVMIFSLWNYMCAFSKIHVHKIIVVDFNGFSLKALHLIILSIFC